MTTNQKPAVILNGTQIPYVTTTVSDGAVQSTVTFKDAFLCLLVDPQIGNGETLVLGGIFDGEETSSVDKVPMLGDMPVFGNLFKTTNKANNKTELIIFLTPRIIDERLSLR